MSLCMKRNHQGEFLIICLYIDGLLYTGSSAEMLAEFKEAMFNEFEMTDNGLMSYFLGIEVKQQQDGVFISQKKYMKEILEKFKMSNCNPVNTPLVTEMKLSREGNGDFVDSTLFKSLVPEVLDDPQARYCLWSRTCELLYGDTEGVLLANCKEDSKVYQRHTQPCLFYTYGETAELVGYSDSDWGGDQDERKSTTGYVFYLGSTAFSWTSKK